MMFEAAKRSQTTCCCVMGGLKSGCPLLSNVFLQVKVSLLHTSQLHSKRAR